MTVAALVVAGALGAVLRHVVDGAARRRWPGAFPGPVFAINVSGSLVIGVVAGAVMFQGAPTAWQAVIGTGFCGGYTTFSTSMAEAVRSGTSRGLAYAAATLVGSVAACAVGLVVAWAL